MTDSSNFFILLLCSIFRAFWGVEMRAFISTAVLLLAFSRELPFLRFVEAKEAGVELQSHYARPSRALSVVEPARARPVAQPTYLAPMDACRPYRTRMPIYSFIQSL